jgi:hypothetical protein
MRKALAAAGWVGGFAVIDMTADRYGLSVTKVVRAIRAEFGPVAFDLMLAGAALGFREHVKRN